MAERLAEVEGWGPPFSVGEYRVEKVRRDRLVSVSPTSPT